MYKIPDLISALHVNACIGNAQALLGIAVWLLAGQSGTAVAHGLNPTPKVESNTAVPCEYALTTLAQHSSLPASRKEGLLAALEAQDETQATFGLFSEANRNIALGWFRIDWKKGQLLDLTNDIEAPIGLTFRHEDWTLVANCLRTPPIAPEPG